MTKRAEKKAARISAALDAGRLTGTDLRRWKRVILACERGWDTREAKHAPDADTLFKLEERAEGNPPLIADADQCLRGIEWLHRVTFTARGTPRMTGGCDVAPEWVRKIIANAHAKRHEGTPRFTFAGWERDYNRFGNTCAVLPCYRLHNPDGNGSFAYVARPWQAGGRGLELVP